VLAFVAAQTGRKISLTRYRRQEFPYRWEAYASGCEGQFLYVTERQQPHRQLDLVCLLDTSESRQESFVADEAAFVESYERTKWDLAQKERMP
jgi:hypothetical protein